MMLRGFWDLIGVYYYFIKNNTNFDKKHNSRYTGYTNNNMLVCVIYIFRNNDKLTLYFYSMI